MHFLLKNEPDLYCLLQPRPVRVDLGCTRQKHGMTKILWKKGRERRLWGSNGEWKRI